MVVKKALACKCKDCTHWEVVSDGPEAKTHLHCKTCGTNIPVRISFIEGILAGMNECHWIVVAEE